MTPTPKEITAIILDGFHKGHVLHMEYNPTVKLPKPGDLSNDSASREVEYKECFRGKESFKGVDRNVSVFYSEKGDPMDFLRWFNTTEYNALLAQAKEIKP